MRMEQWKKQFLKRNALIILCGEIFLVFLVFWHPFIPEGHVKGVILCIVSLVVLLVYIFLNDTWGYMD